MQQGMKIRHRLLLFCVTLHPKMKKRIGKSIQIVLSSLFFRERNQGQAQPQALQKMTPKSGARAEAEVSICDVAALSNQQTITSFANPAWEGKGRIKLCSACKAIEDGTPEKDVDFHTGQLPAQFNINTVP